MTHSTAQPLSRPSVLHSAAAVLTNKRFISGALLGATLCLAATAFGGGWAVLRVGLLVFLSVGLFPFLVAAIPGLVLLAICIGAALTGGNVDTGGYDQPLTLPFGKYYRWLGRIAGRGLRLGVIVGSALALLVLGLWLSLVVLPKETETAQVLHQLRARLEAASAPSAETSDLHKMLPPSAPDDLSVRDAFGAPITYERLKSKPSGGKFQLRSLGLDGKRSGDDLCLQGSHKSLLGRAAQALAKGAEHAVTLLVQAAQGEELSIKEKATVARAATCSKEYR